VISHIQQGDKHNVVSQSNGSGTGQVQRIQKGLPMFVVGTAMGFPLLIAPTLYGMDLVDEFIVVKFIDYVCGPVTPTWC
jgi:hypothetical protein